ncbi:MAG: hypothetical protein LBR88_10520 [Zoogloeaceae bacterium]|nr:hypothetical protein [Zoogloeaceae bacterium]
MILPTRNLPLQGTHVEHARALRNTGMLYPYALLHVGQHIFQPGYLDNSLDFLEIRKAPARLPSHDLTIGGRKHGEGFICRPKRHISTHNKIQYLAKPCRCLFVFPRFQTLPRHGQRRPYSDIVRNLPGSFLFPPGFLRFPALLLFLPCLLLRFPALLLFLPGFLRFPALLLFLLGLLRFPAPLLFLPDSLHNFCIQTFQIAQRSFQDHDHGILGAQFMPPSRKKLKVMLERFKLFPVIPFQRTIW